MLFMSIPNGVQQDNWFPKGEGKDFQFNRTMEPLQSVKQQVQVLGGLDHENATAGNDGAGDHGAGRRDLLDGRSSSQDCWQRYSRGCFDRSSGRTPLWPPDATALARIVLRCDSQFGQLRFRIRCAYQYNLSWSSATTPVTPEPNPRLVFERLFGTGQPGERRRNLQLRQQSNRSVLDFVMEDASDLKRQLGQGDVRKLDEYIEGVRTLEKSIQSSERFSQTPDPDQSTPAGIPPDFAQHIDMMFDLMCLAFQTDTTRISTLLIAYDGSNRTFPDLGIGEGHQLFDPQSTRSGTAEKVAKIDHSMSRVWRDSSRRWPTQKISTASHCWTTV